MFKTEKISSDDFIIFAILYTVNILIMIFGESITYDKFIILNLEDVTYSKPLTLYFCISIIFFLSIYKDIHVTISKSILIIFIIISFYFAILSGGRAEILCLFIVLLYMYTKRVLFFVLLLLITFLYTDLDLKLFENLTGLYRLLLSSEISSQNVLSMRDVLFFIFIDNIDIDCFIFGCGINSFQIKNNLDIGYYPHNLILELIYTVGFIGLIFFMFLAFKSFKKMTFLEKNIFILVVLISMLSGQLITNFILFYFINTNDKISKF